MRLKTRQPGVAGFTLVELLVTLAVLAIVLSLAAPGFADFLRRNQASAVINDYVYALRLARSEAVTESMPVVVCQSSGQSDCTDTNNWEEGWIVFQDPNDDGDCGNDDSDDECDDGGVILLVHNPDAANFTFTATGNPSGGAVVFDPSGYAPAQMSTFSLCETGGRIDPRGVVLNITGRHRTTTSGLSCSS